MISIQYVDGLELRIAELEAYNQTRTDELLAATRRIAVLEAENAILRQKYTESLHTNQGMLMQEKQTAAYIESLREDAERYRWLRGDDNLGDDADHRWEVLGEKSCKDFDVAIDAARGMK